MKIRMDYLFGRAGRALVVGGVLGWTATTSAQTPAYESVGKPAPTQHQGDSAKSASPTEIYPQSALMRVELGWLSERSTYPYPLEAEMRGTALEVRGYVPTETIHERALRIARDESGLRVIDAIHVNSNVIAVPVKKPATLLKREAMACLRQDLRQRAAGITVSIWNDGQVLLKGRVPTGEDKLAASYCMRRVAGCNCVINQLQVPTLSAKSHATNQLQVPTQGAGTHAKPTPDLHPRPAGKPLYAQTSWRPAEAPPANLEVLQPQVIQVASPTELRSLKSPPVAKLSAPVPELGAPTPIEKPPTELGTLKVRKPSPQIRTDPALTRSSAAKDTTQTSLTNPPAAQRKLKETKSSAQQTKNVPAPKLASPSLPKASGPPSEEQKQPAQTINIARPGSGPGVSKTESAIIPVANWKPAATDPTVVAPLPAGPKPLTITFDRATPPATQTPSKKENVGPRSDGYVSAGVVLFSEPPKKEPAPMQSDAYVSSGVILFPPPVKKAPAVSHSGAYVSSGVILLDSSEKPVRPKVRPDLLQKQAHLQQAIAKVCHKAGKDVEVKLLSDKYVVVRVKARSAQEGQTLSSLIFQMPELGPYQVSLDIPLH